MQQNDDIMNILKCNLCPRCGEQDCPFLTYDKRAKQMMDAFRRGDFLEAQKIYIKTFAQTLSMLREDFKSKIKIYESVTDSLRYKIFDNQAVTIPPVLTSALNASLSTLKPSPLIISHAAPVSTFKLGVTPLSNSDPLGTVIGRSVGLGIGLLTYSPPAGAPGIDTLHGFSKHDFDYLTRNTNTARTPVGEQLRVPEERILREVSRNKGIVETYAVPTEHISNGQKIIELTPTNSPVETRVIPAIPTEQKGLFSYSLPNEQKDRYIQIGKPEVFTGTPLPNPKRLKSLPGEIYDIQRPSGIPISSPSFPTSVINSSSNPQSPFIIVFSENIGVKPIYIAASKGGKKNKGKGKDDERKGVKEKGHSYHPAPKVDEIKGLGELKPVQGKTPKQGGGGRRNRWVGDKGRKIYEWDSQHGELEGYRGSDGQHIGAFDPKSGKQLKPADPKRNIKKYL
ncbi:MULTISPECIES: colicin E3/pyocin S6 family cytotoxin [Providencia]|uniref:colicin E3/pyocin S6 family cytotoxin n=1 Tax=Providencia TaxID=586 RepID=UPI00090841AB|nr:MULTISPECIES: colicin E3/pyocin S6 family cytotoxin [Providencia]APC10783.1 Colicin-E3 [Providencia rettgeri]